MKNISLSIDKPKDYLKLFNGFFELTDKELDIVFAFFVYKIRTSDYVFSKEIKDEISESIGLSNKSSINTYIKRIKDKGAFIKKGSKYYLHPMIQPPIEKEIKFNIKL